MSKPYSFEEQFELAERWEKENNVTLFRISDWNVEPDSVDIPLSIIHEATSHALDSITRYPETSLLVATCEEIQDSLKYAYSISFDPHARTHLFANATQAILGVMYSLKEIVPHPKALIIHPSYYSAQEAALLCGIPFIEMWRLKREDFRIDFQILDDHRKQHDINILYLTDPAYSAGISINQLEWEQLMAYCKEWDLWLVIDMAFSGLSWSNPNKAWIDAEKLTRHYYRKAILIDAPSKRLFTNNVKLGLVFADASVTDRLRDFSDWFLGNVTGLQLAFAKLIFDRSNKLELERICYVNSVRAKKHFTYMKYITAQSTKVSTIIPDSGFHALLFAKDVPSHSVNAMDVCMNLVTNYLTLAIPTNDFFYHPEDEFGIRLNLMSRPSKWEHFVRYVADKGLCV